MTLLNTAQRSLVSTLVTNVQGQPTLAISPADGAHRTVIDLFLDLGNRRSDR